MLFKPLFILIYNNNCTNQAMPIKILKVMQKLYVIIFMTIFYHDGSNKNPFLIKPVPEYAKTLKLYTKRYPVNN